MEHLTLRIPCQTWRSSAWQADLVSRQDSRPGSVEVNIISGETSFTADWVSAIA